MSLIAQSLNTLLQHTVMAKVENNDPKRVYVPELDSIRWKILASIRARDKELAVSAMNAYIEHTTHSSNE
jgi:DNA-binding FadR family transcriptional regulator